MFGLRAPCAPMLVLLAALGCKSAPRVEQATPLAPARAYAGDPEPGSETLALRTAAGGDAQIKPQPIATVHFQESLPLASLGAASTGQQEMLGEVLSRDWLQTEVEARNPSIEAMISAWQAAAQVYPQRVALDDPVLMGMIAPQSVAANTTETAYAFQLNQKLPWFGKRSLRGAVAAADADAAYQEAEDSRLQVRLAADLAFFEYFLVARLIEINQDNTRLMREFREAAQTKYRVGTVTQQDLLQADLELAELARRQLELARMQRIAVARINTLLRRWPDAPLPPPPANLDSPQPVTEANLLWQTALQQRPDLAALASRVQSAEVSLELAYKNYRPDVDVFGRYDTFWQPASTQGPLRAQVGVAMNLPVYREKLRAAVCEAQFRLNQRRAEFDQRSLEIQHEVLSAAAQAEESRQTVDLYAQRLVPVAEQNVAAARTNYEVSKLNFLQLAQTQRQLIMLRERQIEAIIAYHRRMAELNRAVGGAVLVAP